MHTLQTCRISSQHFGRRSFLKVCLSHSDSPARKLHISFLVVPSVWLEPNFCLHLTLSSGCFSPTSTDFMSSITTPPPPLLFFQASLLPPPTSNCLRRFFEGSPSFFLSTNMYMWVELGSLVCLITSCCRFDDCLSFCMALWGTGNLSTFN